MRRSGHLVQFEAGQQTVGFEGFPNQRMDMTGTENWQFTARYTGTFGWAIWRRGSATRTRSTRWTWGRTASPTATGMPMDTEARTDGALGKANVILS